MAGKKLKSKYKFRTNVLSSNKSAVLLVEKTDGVTLEDELMSIFRSLVVFRTAETF